MTMHILGPHMTTTKYNSKSKKTKNKRLLAAQERHEKWMNDNGYNKKPKESVNKIPNYSSNRPAVPLSNDICSNGTAKDKKEYTGTLVKGIATMHKSNAVPISSAEQAIEISAMRR